MSLIEPGDFNEQLRSARSWMKRSTAAGPGHQVLLDHEGDAPKSAAEPVHRDRRADTDNGASKAFMKTDTTLQSSSLHSTSKARNVRHPGHSNVVAAGQYDRMIEDMTREESRIEIIQHVIKVERSEVTALVKQIARAKGRYLATLLEACKGKSVSGSSIEDLKQLRETHEELQQGLADLRRHILDGTVMVEGVRN